MNRIKVERAILDISQEKLAAELKVTKQTVYRWESGENSPDIETIVKMVKLFGCTSDWLLGISERRTIS